MDNAHADGLNQALVQKLFELNHIQSDAVAAAFLATPRHFFAAGMPLDEAYANRALALKQEGDTWVSSISQPTMIAIMLEQLELHPGMRVLEIGAGSGYNAALMAHLVGDGGRVISLDIDQDLVAAARANLAKAGVPNVEVVCADGGLGHAAAAPYDRIILTVGAADISPHWVAQLASNGRLLLPLAVGRQQLSVAFDPMGDSQTGYLKSQSAKECAFIRLRGAYAAPGVEQLDLAPGAELYLPSETAQSAAGQILAWLAQPPRDWPTGVQITRRVTWRSLELWLMLHEPHMAGLRIAGPAIDSGLASQLHLFAEEPTVVYSAILCGPNGLAALLSARSTPYFPNQGSDAEPFDLIVRQFGADESLAKRLVKLVQAWETAGRPTSEGLQLTAYPKSRARPDTAGLLVEKPATWLVLEW